MYSPESHTLLCQWPRHPIHGLQGSEVCRHDNKMGYPQQLFLVPYWIPRMWLMLPMKYQLENTALLLQFNISILFSYRYFTYQWMQLIQIKFCSTDKKREEKIPTRNQNYDLIKKIFSKSLPLLTNVATGQKLLVISPSWFFMGSQI